MSLGGIPVTLDDCLVPLKTLLSSYFFGPCIVIV